MDELIIKRLVDKHSPKMNQSVMNGLATEIIPHAVEWVDRVIKNIARNFPSGLEYTGWQPCSPEQEFQKISEVKKNKRVFELAKSTLFMIRLNFRYNGEDLLPRYVYIPFIPPEEGAGIIHLYGSRFHIQPVLSDPVISPDKKTVFVRLLYNRIIFDRTYHPIVINGVRDLSQVVWAPIHVKMSNNVGSTTKAVSCISHYLLARYGLREVCQRYYNTEVVVGQMEINVNKYPMDKWVIVQSNRVQPKTNIDFNYSPSLIKIAVPIDKWTPEFKSFISGLYYVIDHFPNNIRVEDLDNKDNWMVLLGHIIFSGIYSVQKLRDDIGEHFDSITSYVDDMSQISLKRMGYYVNDFYDLLAVILNNFNSLVINNNDISSNMYGKSLEILYYILYNIVSSINSVNFALQKLSKRQTLTPTDINNIMNKMMGLGKTRVSSNDNVSVAPVGYSGDHKYLKITRNIVLQQSIPGITKMSKRRFVLDGSKRAHPSYLECGSIYFLNKNDPTPARHFNPYIKVNEETGIIEQKEHMREEISHVDELLKDIYS